MTTSATTNAAPGPVTFWACGYGDPDVRLDVFGLEFRVHYKKLEEHSQFFHIYDNSAAKAGDRPSTSGYQHDWVTKVDEDDSMALKWHLVKAGPKVCICIQLSIHSCRPLALLE